MPRFAVTLADANDNTIQTHVTQAELPSKAILSHPWFTEIYKEEWLIKTIYNRDQEHTCENILNTMGWLATCVNLDIEIMNVLNGGDGSASFKTEQATGE